MKIAGDIILKQTLDPLIKWSSTFPLDNITMIFARSSLANKGISRQMFSFRR